jgi:hypothetical protein
MADDDIEEWLDGIADGTVPVKVHDGALMVRITTLDRALREEINAARAAGLGWPAIGVALGITGVEAEKRYGDREVEE